ncbi:WD repeat-containing protein 91 [Ciona intestinalis]
MSWTSSTGLMDSLVRDYLLQRGFNSALKSFDFDSKNDKEKGFRVDKILQYILSMVANCDLDSLRLYWSHLDQRLFCLLGEQAQTSTVKKMEFNLYRYYIVNALQNGKRKECFEFYEKMSTELQSLPEWKDWFSFPFTPHPESNKLYSNYFTKQWSDTFLVSLQNFLAVTFSCLPAPDLLSSFNKDQATIDKLESENELLRLTLSEININPVLREENKVPNYVRGLGVPGALVENEPSAVQTQKKKSAFSFPSKKTTPPTTSPKLNKQQKSTQQQQQQQPKQPPKQTNPPIKTTAPNTQIEQQPPTSQPPSDNLMQRNKKLSGYQNQRRELFGTSRSIDLDPQIKPPKPEPPAPQSNPTPNLPKEDPRSSPLIPNLDLQITKSSSLWLQSDQPPESASDEPFLKLSKDEYHDHHSSIMQCRFNPQGNSIASVDKDGVVKIWQFEPNPVTIATVMSRSPFLSLDWHTSATDLVLLGSSNGTIKIYNAASKVSQHDVNISGNCPRVNQLSCHPGGTSFVTSCISNGGFGGYTPNTQDVNTPGRVQIWNINESQVTLDSSLQECSDRHIECLAYSKDGNYLATGDSKGKLTVFDTRTYKLMQSRQAHSGPIYTVQFSQDERFVFTLGADGKFCAWNLASPIEPTIFPIHASAGGPFEVTGFSGYKQVQQPGGGRLFAFEPHGNHVLTCDGSSAVVYEVNISLGTLKKVLTLVDHRSPVLSLDWTSALKCAYCMTGGMDGKVNVTTLLKK